MIIAIDFDGTLCDHRFPEIGAEVPGAIEWCKRFQELGARLILFTMRSDMRADASSPEGHRADRDFLGEAISWCADRGLRFWAHNENPEQSKWTQSPKVYAQLYIDDAAHGCPLRKLPRIGSRPAVDWSIVGPAVVLILATPPSSEGASDACE